MPDSARVHGRTHTHAHTPRNLRSSLERRQDTSEGGTRPERGHRLKSPPCWLCASVSPLGAGHPAPSRCPASPQRHRYSPVPGYPSPALCRRAPPCTPKAPTVAPPRQGAPPSHQPYPTALPWPQAGCCHRVPVPWDWDLGVRAAPLPTSILLGARTALRAGSQQGQGYGGTRTEATLPPQGWHSPALSHAKTPPCSGWLLTAGEL